MKTGAATATEDGGRNGDGAMKAGDVPHTPNPMLLGADPSSVAGMSSDDEPDTRTDATSAPQRSVCRRRAPLIIGAAIVLAAVTVGVLIAVMTTRTASLSVPDQFAASFTVVHSDGDADTLYDGSLVKTLDADGEWVVSGSLTVSSESHAMATTYTFLDDKGYYQVKGRETGEFVGVGCLTPADVPPLAGFSASITDASVIEGVTLSASVVAACEGATPFAVRFFGQTYVYCFPGSTHILVGSAFTARLFDVDTSAAAAVHPSSPPLNTTGTPMECDALGVAETARNVAIQRRLSQEPHVHEAQWYAVAESREAEAEAPSHGRMLPGDDDPNDDNGCCNCRRRLELESLDLPTTRDPAAPRGEMAARSLSSHFDPDGCCGCRRRLWWQEALMDAPEERDTRNLRADGRELWARAQPAAVTARRVVSQYPGVNLPTAAPTFPNANTQAMRSDTDPTPEICICCLIPGIETVDLSKLPAVCGGTLTRVSLDVTKPWYDADELASLCEQISTAGVINPHMHVYAASSGNYALAKAISDGLCDFGADGDNKWTLLEGMLPLVNSATGYCDAFTKSIGGVSVYLGLPHLCVWDGSSYAPTPVLLALDASHPDRTAAEAVMKNKVDSVVATGYQSGFATGPVDIATGPAVLSVRQIARSPAGTDTIATAMIDDGTVSSVSVLGSPHNSATTVAQDWGVAFFDNAGAGAVGGSSGGLFTSRRLHGFRFDDHHGGDSCQVPGPRTGFGGMVTMHNYMSYANTYSNSNT